MNSRTKRARRRANKKQHVKHLNKMQVAESLIVNDPPSRIFFKRDENDHEMVVCYITNRTEIMAIGKATHSVVALVMAAKVLRDEYDEESMFVIGGDSEQVAAAGAAETMDPTNPIHIICDTCGSGMNEKCVTKSGTKLKNFHVARTRTARQYSNAKQYGADAAKAQQDRRTQEQPSA